MNLDSECMTTSGQGNFAPSHSSSIAYDKELWDVLVSTLPDSSTISDAEKHWMLQDVLVISGGTRERAFQYLEDYKQVALDPNTPRIGFQCPRENISCKSVEFDNIKVFYHPTYSDRSIMDIWNFYIGRPGTPASQCLDWAKENIKVEVCGPTGQWGGTTALLVPASTRVRFTYTYRNKLRRHEIVFPPKYSPVPTTYLEPM